MTFLKGRRRALRAIAIAVAATGISASAYADRDHEDQRGSLRQGSIFVSTNARTGNEVLIYKQSDTGPAQFLTRVPTNGIGTGAGLGSQGAVTLSKNRKYLFVVNAGSSTVSTFSLRGNAATLASVVPSGGTTPTSVTENDGVVYVLNAGGVGNVAGFRNSDGVLEPIADSVRGLSIVGGTAPAQVSFNHEGDLLVVSERASSVLTSFPVRSRGRLGDAVITPSAGGTPFGFAFSNRDYLVVSEAGGSTVSSYRFSERAPATPIVVSASVPTTQTAACWIAVTPNGKFAYSANAGSSSVSSFGIGRNGSLTLLAAQAGTTSGGALDLAVTPGGEQLHVLASRGLQIVSYTITSDGGLTPLGGVGGLPVGSAGLAAN